MTGQSYREMAKAEQSRVRDLLARDRRDESREAMRQLAEMEVREGVYVNISDAVMEPTPEWLEKGDTRSMRVKQPDDTVREVKTVRRVLTPIVVRLWKKDQLTDDQINAVMWFREMHELAGMEGRYVTSGFANRLSLADRGRAGHVPVSESELHARQMLRMARESITTHRLRFFEAVVVGDVPISRAARMVRCRKGAALKVFAQEASRLADFCAREKVDLRGPGALRYELS